MRKALIALLILLPMRVSAQNTTVSFTMVDTDGTHWFTGAWKMDFHPNPNQPGEGNYRLINGQPLSGTVLHQNGTTDVNGFASIVVYDSTLVTPSGSGWTLTLCPNASAACGVYQFSSAGGSMDLSSNLTIRMPVPRFEATGNKAYGYIDTEAMVKVATGGCYWNVTSNAQRCWNGTQFVNAAGSGGTVTPGGQPGEVQINNGTTSLGAASGVTYTSPGGLTASGAISAQTLGGSCYAKQWATPSGTGTNGIGNAMAGGCSTVVSDVTYSNTEQPTISSFNTTPVFHQDQRGNFITEYFRNPGTDSTGSPANYLNRFGFIGMYGRATQCMFDATYPNAYANNRLGCSQINITSINPGYDSNNNWQVPVALRINNTSHSMGTNESINIVETDHGVGDKAPLYCYSYGSGGQVAGSSEGQKCLAWGTIENNYTFAATVTTNTPSVNPTKIVTATPALTSNGFGATGTNSAAQGVGRLLINMGTCSSYPGTCTAPAAPNTGQITASANGFDTATSALTINQTVPASNAWGTVSGTVNTPISIQPPLFSSPMTVNITGAFGTFVVGNPATGTGLVCFTGQWHECAYPTGVSGSGSSQTITIPLRHTHSGGAVFQGGMAGYCLVLPAFTQTTPTIAGVVGQPMRYCYDVFGSTASNVLQVGRFGFGTQTKFDYASITNTATLAASLSSSGTTVTGSIYSVNGAFIAPNGSIMITGSDGGLLDGQCNNLQYTNTLGSANNGAFTCTNPNLTGTITNTTAQPKAQPMATNCSTCTATAGIVESVYNLYPAAEVLDVRGAGNPPMVDGTLTVEPNILGSPTLVEQPHHITGEYEGYTTGMNAYDPFTTSYNNMAAQHVFGAAFSGGGLSGASNAFFQWNNLNSDSMYFMGGGILGPPNFANIGGDFNTFFNLNHLPSSGSSSSATANTSALFMINPVAAQLNDVSLNANLFYIWTKPGSTGHTSWTLAPNTGNTAWYTDGVTTYAASAHNFSGPVNMSSATISTAGGMISGLGVNYVLYSNDLSQNQFWRFTGGTAGTITCGLTDDSGNPACSMVQATGNGTNCTAGNGCNWNFTNVPVVLTGLTALIPGNPYTMQAHIRGGAGGEVFLIGVSNASHQFTATSQWADYCWTFTAGTTALNSYASINQNLIAAGPQTLYVSNVVTRPGSACGPPTYTTNNQVINPTPVNHFPGAATVIASGTVALPFTALGSGSCYPNTTTTATGVLSTDTLNYAFQGAPDSSWGSFVIHQYVAANLVGFQVCNPPGGGSQTPVAATLNWKVTR